MRVVIRCLVTVGLSAACAGVETRPEVNPSAATVETCADIGGEGAQAPLQYVLEQLRSHRVVALGEDHWIKEQVGFVHQVIEAALRDELIDVVALEFGTTAYQELADRIVVADAFDQEAVLEIFSDMSDAVGWGFQDYVELFRVVWQANHGRSGPPFRLLLVDNPLLPGWWNGEIQLAGLPALAGAGAEPVRVPGHAAALLDRDKHMAEVIEDEIINKNLRALYYAGAYHVASHPFYSRAAGIDKKPSLDLPTGYYLEAKYPGEYFSIKMHGFHYGERPDELPMQGRLDAILSTCASQQFGTDLAATHLGATTASLVYPEMSPAADPSITVPFNRYHDGYIFLGLLKDYVPVERIAGYYDDAFLEVVQRRFDHILAKRGKPPVSARVLIDMMFTKERFIFSRASKAAPTHSP